MMKEISKPQRKLSVPLLCSFPDCNTRIREGKGETFICRKVRPLANCKFVINQSYSLFLEKYTHIHTHSKTKTVTLNTLPSTLVNEGF